jgi:transcription factor IIIB subunit 2
MNAQVCKICSGITQWDESANSIVCIDCGSLEDSSQTVLTSGQGSGETGPQSSAYLNPFAGSTLKSSAGRALYGQPSKGKQRAAHSREMHQYIESILRNISQSGLKDRATYLFNLAMDRAGYRWGRQAKLAAGACIMIALNESQRGETTATLAVSSPFKLSVGFSCMI